MLPSVRFFPHFLLQFLLVSAELSGGKCREQLEEKVAVCWEKFLQQNSLLYRDIIDYK